MMISYTVPDNIWNLINIAWDVHFMSKAETKYALYDVLFLQYYIENIFKTINKETPQYVNTYKYINSMIRYIFIERNGVTNTIETAKDIINPLNNYLIKHDGKNHTLITIYNNVIKNFKI